MRDEGEEKTFGQCICDMHGGTGQEEFCKEEEINGTAEVQPSDESGAGAGHRHIHTGTERRPFHAQGHRLPCHRRPDTPGNHAAYTHKQGQFRFQRVCR